MLIRKVVVLAIGCAAIGASGAPANSQSFNCRYAKSPVEIAICQNNELSILDEGMASLYSIISNSIPRNRAYALKSEQIAFLKERDSCGYDFTCIRSSYNMRINELCGWASFIGRPCEK